MTDLKINVDGQELTIQKQFTDNYLKVFDDRVNDLREYNDNNSFTELYEREATNTQKEIHDERIALVNLLQDLDSGVYDTIIKSVQSITKTKKGVLRKNGVAEFFVISSATEYFTDYTNAWHTKVIKLRALTPTTLELVFEDKTYTF